MRSRSGSARVTRADAGAPVATSAAGAGCPARGAEGEESRSVAPATRVESVRRRERVGEGVGRGDDVRDAQPAEHVRLSVGGALSEVQVGLEVGLGRARRLEVPPVQRVAARRLGEPRRRQEHTGPEDLIRIVALGGEPGAVGDDAPELGGGVLQLGDGRRELARRPAVGAERRHDEGDRHAERGRHRRRAGQAPPRQPRARGTARRRRSRRKGAGSASNPA